MFLLIIFIVLIAIAAYAIFRHCKTRNSHKLGVNNRSRKR